IWNGGAFQTHMGHLYYSDVAYRRTETIDTHVIVNREDRGVTLIPATCFVFDFGAHADESSVRSMDFPPQGQLPLDKSKYINSCMFSPSSHSIVVSRESSF